MNIFKLGLVSLVMWTLAIGAVSAKENSKSKSKRREFVPPTEINFSGVGISANQFLRVYLSKPASMSSSNSQCNAIVNVVDIAGQEISAPVAVQGIAPGETVPLDIQYTPAQAGYFKVSVTGSNSNGASDCNKLNATLGVYNVATQDLQLLVNASSRSDDD